MMSKLNFTMQPQAQKYWCWAAVSASTCLFYNPTSTWTQCKLADQAFGATYNCCQNGSSTNCNQPWYLDKALKLVGHLRGTPAPFPASFTNVQSEIGNSRVLGVRIGWQGGGVGHFITVVGFDQATQYVWVEDPWLGPSSLPYTQLVSGYQATGAWTDSYFTN